MPTTTLARYGAPIAIVAGVLVTVTRLVILFTTPAEITAAALDKSDAIAEEALEMFVTCLGRTAGDLALVLTISSTSLNSSAFTPFANLSLSTFYRTGS